ncbi:MAG: hypothetical protein P4L40_17375 [Terracidiphilus sp.]|nr:hypothetical protein [Terracidiphilus sp.]
MATPAKTLHNAQAAVNTLGRACARLPTRHAASVDTFNHLATGTGVETADWARTVLFDFRSLVGGREGA